MYFVTADGMRPAPLTHNPFNAIVMPRPIAWVSTVDAAGRANLAPFSYFNGVSSDPPYVMFAPNAAGLGTAKDTYRNLLDVPEFVVSLCTETDAAHVNATSASYPPGVDEFEACGVAKAASVQVRPPRVGSAPAALECRVYTTLALPKGADGRESHIVVGEVVGMYIADHLIVDGRVDERRIAPLTRLGYFDYGTLGRVFELKRPPTPD
jgi:flavin reductase (DIM6/NTAB) family NADH-FMN oxidoreductase RutF